MLQETALLVTLPAVYPLLPQPSDVPAFNLENNVVVFILFWSRRAQGLRIRLKAVKIGMSTDTYSQMMFVSGETAEPGPETTWMIEEIVREQVIEMVCSLCSP